LLLIVHKSLAALVQTRTGSYLPKSLNS